MGLKVTRKTANTLMLIPIDIMFVLNIMLLVYVWQNSGIENMPPQDNRRLLAETIFYG